MPISMWHSDMHINILLTIKFESGNNSKSLDKEKKYKSKISFTIKTGFG